MLLVYQFIQVYLFIYYIYIVSYFEACLCRCLFFIFIPSLPVCLLMAKEWSDISDEFPLDVLPQMGNIVADSWWSIANSAGAGVRTVKNYLRKGWCPPERILWCHEDYSTHDAPGAAHLTFLRSGWLSGKQKVWCTCGTGWRWICVYNIGKTQQYLNPYVCRTIERHLGVITCVGHLHENVKRLKHLRDPLLVIKPSCCTCSTVKVFVTKATSPGTVTWY